MRSLTPEGNVMETALTVIGRLSVAGCPERPCLARINTVGPFLILVRDTSHGGDAAVCRLDGIGVIPGWVGPPCHEGFTMIPDLSKARSARVAARLAWRSAYSWDGKERRGALRLVPVQRTVAIRVSEGFVVEGEIEDMSKSGVRIRFAPSVEAHRFCPPGMLITVGKRYADVVRVEEHTIAASFRLPFTDETFNPSVLL